MGQAVSAPSSPIPAAPGLSRKARGKRVLNTSVDITSVKPKRSRSLDNGATLEHEQHATRVAAEHHLERQQRPSLVTRDSSTLPAASPIWGQLSDDSDEIEGLRIQIRGRRLSAIAKRHSSTHTAPYYASARASLDQTPDEDVASLHIRLEHGDSTYEPLAQPPASTRHQKSPVSHWSESSTGEQTPPPSFQAFRNSMTFTGNTKRLSTISSNPRQSVVFGESDGSSTTAVVSEGSISHNKSLSQTISHGIEAVKNGKESKRRRKAHAAAVKKRGPITVVSATRLGSDRYSAMQAASAKEKAEEATEAAVVRPTSDAHVEEQPRNRPVSKRLEDAVIRRSPYAEALSSFIAASPDLTFAAPDAALFDYSPSPRPLIMRHPAGHPGAHHERFRSVDARSSSSLSIISSLPPPRDLPPVPPSSSRHSSENSLNTGPRVELAVDTVAAEDRRGSAVAWTAARQIPPNRRESAGAASIEQARKASLSSMPFLTEPPTNWSRRASGASAISFPRSIDPTSSCASTPAYERRESTLSFESNIAGSATGSAPLGEHNWATYSMRSRPSIVSRSSTGTQNLPSEMVDAFPIPPPAPSSRAASRHPFVYDDETMLGATASEASTPSTDSSSPSSDGEEEAPTLDDSLPAAETSSRHPSKDRLESPFLQIVDAVLPVSTARLGLTPSFANFSFQQPTLSKEAFYLSAVISPTANSQNPGTPFDDDGDEDDEAARSRFPTQNLPLSGPYEEKLGRDFFASRSRVDEEAPSVRPRHSTTGFPSPPLVPYEPSVRRGTFPTWTPPSMRKKPEGFEVLVTDGSRLGSAAKRGLDRAEISAWLQGNGVKNAV